MEILRCQIDMVLVSFLYISRISEYENSLAITSHQFSLYLAIISHHPNGVMRICGLLAAKKVKKVRDNYLTSTGWGALCVRESLPV